MSNGSPVAGVSTRKTADELVFSLLDVWATPATPMTKQTDATWRFVSPVSGVTADVLAPAKRNSTPLCGVGPCNVRI